MASAAGAPSILADPVILENGDGTRTAVWSLDTVANLTLANATVAGGQAWLTSRAYAWTVTSEADFSAGTGTSTSVLPPGSLTLQRLLNPERLAASRDNGNIISLRADGSQEWVGTQGGKVRAVVQFDRDQDGFLDDVVGVSDTTASSIRAFGYTGTSLWTNTDPGTTALRAAVSLDLDQDSLYDSIVAGGDDDFLYAVGTTGNTLWTNDTGGRIRSLAAVDLDADGFVDEVAAATDVGQIVAYDETGRRLWTYGMVAQTTGPVVAVADPSTGVLGRIAAVDASGYLVLLDSAGSPLWWANLNGAGSALAALDFDEDGFRDDVSAGDVSGLVRNYENTGAPLGTYTFAGGVQDLAAGDLDSDGSFEFVYGGDTAATAAAFDAAGVEQWSLPLPGTPSAVTAVDLDGDGYVDDAAAGTTNGRVATADSNGVPQWGGGVNVGGMVHDLARLHNADRYETAGSWESAVLDAQGRVLWGALFWNATLPAGTNVTLETRTGEVPVPDASWSGWSTVAAPGSTIASPPARYGQARVVLTTTDDLVRPRLEDFTITYTRYDSLGRIETEDLAPTDLLAWSVFDFAGTTPAGTGLSAEYSVDGGGSWNAVLPGTNLSGVASPRLRYRLTLSTTDTTLAPSLDEIRQRYAFLGALDHIEISPTTWSGSADGTVDFDAAPHDAFHRLVSVSLKWETDDPAGTVDGNGVYAPGTVGTWRVHANTTDNSLGAFATVTVTAGVRTRVAIVPWSPGTVAAGGTLDLTAYAYDSDGNDLGTADVYWTLSSAIGWLTPAGGQHPSVTFRGTTVGSGRVTIDDGAGLTNTSDWITVVPGPLDHIHVLPDNWNGTVDDRPDFDALGHDAFENAVTFTAKWSTDDPGGAVTSAGVYTPGLLGTWRVFANTTDDSVSSWANVSVAPGATARIGITPWNPSALAAGTSLAFAAEGWDSAGNPVGPVNVTWGVSGPIGTLSPGSGTSTTFSARTAGTGWLTANDGLGHTNTTAVIRVVPGPIDHIHITPPSWSGPSDSLIDFDAVAHDANDNVVAFTPAWATDDPGGLIDGSGYYQAGRVGAWRVYANDSLSGVSGEANVTVTAGAIARIEINPAGPLLLTADDSVLFEAQGFDLDGNDLGPVAAWWTVWNGIGVTSPGGFALAVTFSATTAGTGSLIANDGIGHTDTVDIAVAPGTLDQILVQPNPVTAMEGTFVNFTATGLDADENTVALNTSSWSTDVGSVVWSNDTEARVLVELAPRSGTVTVTSGGVQGVAFIDTLSSNDAPVIVGVVPNQVRPEDYGNWGMDLGPFASDADDATSTLRWSLQGVDPALANWFVDPTNPHRIILSSVPDAYGNDLATLVLTDPEGARDAQALWINITPVNDLPTMQGIDPFTVRYAMPYRLYFYNYLNDVETPRESLALSLPVTGPTDPNAEILPYVQFDGLWGTFTFPAPYDGRKVYPRIRVTDWDGGFRETSLAISVSSDYVPTLVSELPDVELFEGEYLAGVFDLDDYFEDQDNDALFYTNGSTNVEVLIKDDHTVDFFSPGDFTGVEFVTFKAIDPHNARAEDVVQVTVKPVNDPPVIAGVPDLVVHFDADYRFDLRPYLHDVETPVANLTLWTLDPVRARFFAPDRTVLVLNYPESMNGTTVPLTIAVSDGEDTATQTIDVAVSDDWPPIATVPLPSQTFFEDTFLAGLPLADYFDDPDGDALYISAGNRSVLVSIDPATDVANLSAVPDWYGWEFVTFRAMDPEGAIAEQTINITVLPVEDEPYFLPIPDIEMEVGTVMVVDLLQYARDVDTDAGDLVFFLEAGGVGRTAVVGQQLILDVGSNQTTSTLRLVVSDGTLTGETTVLLRVVPKPPPEVIATFSWPLLVLSLTLIASLLAIAIRRLLLKMVVEEALLIYADGSVLARVSGQGNGRKVDEDLFSSMLTALQDFARDSFAGGENDSLKRVEFGRKKILLERGRSVVLAVVYTGWEKPSRLEEIAEIVEAIERDNGILLANWDGMMERVTELRAYLEPLIAENPAEGNPPLPPPPGELTAGGTS